MAFSPRIYRIRHKHLSNNQKFEIDKDTDEILYTVHATPLGLTDKLSICEASSNKTLIKVRQECCHFHIAYEISVVNGEGDNDKHLATIKKIHGQHHFESSFEVDSIYGVYKVERVGNLFDHEFQLTTGGQTVVSTKKATRLLQHPEEYKIEISNDEGGDLFLLALAIAILYSKRWCLG